MLSNGDSRQILTGGFQVDPESKTGISVRNADQSGLAEMIDSQRMVRGLAATQEYHKFNLFITFTCNQNETPGVAHLLEWKKSEEWMSNFEWYGTLSDAEREELIMAMEDASAVVLLRQWVNVRKVFLRYLMDKVSFLRCKGSVLFGRDEYQGDKGNLFHDHLVIVLDTTSIPEDELNFFFLTTCCTLQRLISFVQKRHNLWLIKDNWN